MNTIEKYLCPNCNSDEFTQNEYTYAIFKATHKGYSLQSSGEFESADSFLLCRECNHKIPITDDNDLLL